MNKYKDITKKEHEGFDITIHETINGTYVVDIKKTCGEFVWGWERVIDSNAGLMKAVNFIDSKVLTILDEVAA